MNRIVKTEYAMFICNRQTGDEFICAGPCDNSVDVDKEYAEKLKDPEFVKTVNVDTAQMCRRQIVITQDLWEPYERPNDLAFLTGQASKSETGFIEKLFSRKEKDFI